MRILVCLSGGIDSAVVLSMAQERGQCSAVFFDYDQPHAIEKQYAHAVAARAGVDLRQVNLPPLSKSDDVVFIGRNFLFAAHAVAIAASSGFDAVALGCNASDWDRFPDCRPDFWKAVNAASDAYGIHVMMPVLRMTKAEVVAEARRRGISLEQTWSCYDPQHNEPCGQCLACETRAAACA